MGVRVGSVPEDTDVGLAAKFWGPAYQPSMTRACQFDKILLVIPRSRGSRQRARLFFFLSSSPNIHSSEVTGFIFGPLPSVLPETVSVLTRLLRRLRSTALALT